ERMQQRFDEMDTNHDGALDESELKATILPRLMRRLEEQRSGGGASTADRAQRRAARENKPDPHSHKPTSGSQPHSRQPGSHSTEPAAFRLRLTGDGEPKNHAAIARRRIKNLQIGSQIPKEGHPLANIQSTPVSRVLATRAPQPPGGTEQHP